MQSSPSSVLVVCTLQHGWPLKVFIPFSFFFFLFSFPPTSSSHNVLHDSFSMEHTALYNLVSMFRVNHAVYLVCFVNRLKTNPLNNPVTMFLLVPLVFSPAEEARGHQQEIC